MDCMKVSVLHVSLHMSGWHSFEPGHCGVKKSLALSKPVKFREATWKAQLNILRDWYGLDSIDWSKVLL